MKKKLLIGAMLMGVFFTANAQIYEGTFDDDADIENWIIVDADGDELGWEIFEGDATTAEWGIEGNFAGSRSWMNNTILTPDNYLLSPFITLPEGGDYELTFNVGVTYYSEADGDPEKMSIYVTTIEDPTIGELEGLTAIYSETYADDFETTVEEQTVDLSDYAGQTIKIVFRHHDSSNQEIVYIDNVVVDEVTASVNDVLASKFSVYPNPASNVINLTNAENILVGGVVITDLNGRTVKNVAFDGVASAQINIADLSAGMYMMTVSSDKGTMTKKIVKN